MSTNMTVANTIRDQIGNLALRMIGAKDLLGEDRALHMRVGRNAKGVTHITIVLDETDTYTMTFARVRGASRKVLAESSFIYADQLRAMIEAHTGMYTSM